MQGFSMPESGARFLYVRDRDRDVILLVYLLYGVGFLTGVTALIGAGIAHWHRWRCLDAAVRGQLTWQIRMFWCGVLAWMVIGVVHGAVAALGAVTGGIGLIFMVVPWGMIAVWGVLTVWAMVRGLSALYRGRVVV